MDPQGFAASQDRFTPGDLIRTGPNPYPRYRVVAVSGGKVWVRNMTTSADAVVDCARCALIEPSERPVEAAVTTPG